MAKRNKQKSSKGALIKGMAKNLPSDILTDHVFKEKLDELLKGNAGIYALYKDERLYYVGLANNLYGRVKNHLRDRHAKKWNKLSMFIIKKVRYLKDIETLVLQIANPKGNKTFGKVPRSANLNFILYEILRKHQKKIKAIKQAIR